MNSQIEVPIPPVISRNNFNCPHCGAHSNQTWYRLYASAYDKDAVPNMPDSEFIDRIQSDGTLSDEVVEDVIKWCEKMALKQVFFEENARAGGYLGAQNLNLSKCYSCGEIAVWVHDALIYPSQKYGISPNPDLPQDVRLDYDEAREIVERSPRGAAALLRLAIQKLCVHLGESGKNINADIASLVQKGLDLRVQQALDVVRVVGNSAVHPGQMDLEDNKSTAIALFGLVNFIADKMISEPKHINDLFEALPEGVKNGIENRDKC